MTIPTLINKTNNQEYVSRLKKTYSTLAQATNRIIAEEGNPRADIGGWATSTEAIFDLYKKHLNTARECEVGKTGCFKGLYKRLNGSFGNLNDTEKYAFVLSDGAAILMGDSEFRSNCNFRAPGTYNLCQHILVDINGAKGPNSVGVDTFSFSLREDGLVPTGCEYDACVKDVDLGWGCACKVLREGAINY